MNLGPTHWIVDHGRHNDLGNVEANPAGRDQVGLAMDKVALAHIDGTATLDGGGTVELNHVPHALVGRQWNRTIEKRNTKENEQQHSVSGVHGCARRNPANSARSPKQHASLSISHRHTDTPKSPTSPTSP